MSAISALIALWLLAAASDDGGAGLGSTAVMTPTVGGASVTCESGLPVSGRRRGGWSLRRVARRGPARRLRRRPSRARAERPRAPFGAAADHDAPPRRRARRRRVPRPASGRGIRRRAEALGSRPARPRAVRAEGRRVAVPP